MAFRVPSLSSLRAFEAAAAHLNLRRAAADLYVTESAVSRQIATLESQLGVQLFHRVNQRLTLTPAGKLYSRQVRETLRKLQRDTLDIMAHEGSGGIVELACLPTLAVEWLIPRLPEFYARHPQVVLNLTARSDVFLFDGTDFDAAIHFGEPHYPGARADPLFPEESVPVCHPDYFGGRKRIRPADIAGAELLHLSTRQFEWEQWMRLAGVEDVNAMRGTRYDHHSMVIAAARAKLGIGLVPRFLVERYLNEGELVMPVPLAMPSSGGYYLVYPEMQPVSDAMSRVREWLLESASEFVRATQARA
ncbi:LysR family transcriptional regulator [Cupriavidus gilardii CR3]|uniref:LysR family transcriptional regulator n=1 Tax=Cupriavidus gilardii TaxID=82541 RepID=A0A849BFK3_9BURK|nr:LysR substrate-binding domain-containing protein [Cupriavidus gilardii]ALD93313.1 LysR family transcriptional regulator [Cupriavidus gilardii CR3]KAB0599283.1 LysR family transcriptional regulator [Cupriavidus gilardii]MCT9013249.1 LysR substrate-binding domain-containing protein [Cupriavidus gilardii]MCT9052803.1 LysR substrate-binding domain-containing protein [Cupriavidus gilardii]NNH12884.1 LysR family transcriptional regulator [Cupriavidus gilardii]